MLDREGQRCLMLRRVTCWLRELKALVSYWCWLRELFPCLVWRDTLMAWTVASMPVICPITVTDLQHIEGQVLWHWNSFGAICLRVSHIFISLMQDINSLELIVDISVIKISASGCHFWQCPWDLGSVWAERVGHGEVGGCTQRVQTALPCLGSSLETTWLVPRGPFLSFLV